MRLFLPELYKRNRLLFLMGWYHLVMFFFCLGLMSFNHQIISGENSWAKPARYFLSSGICVWTLGWIFYYVHSKSVIRICSWLAGLSLFFETAIIFLQSKRGVASHFNNSSPFDSMMYTLMVLLMAVFLMTLTYFTFAFFTQKKMPISQHFTWGIKMGLLNFLIFSVAGIIMFVKMGHTIGGHSGAAGMPFFNWAYKYGDLRISLFMGIHSLQIIPLLSYFLFTKKIQVINFSVLYFLATLSFLILALLGIPIFG